MMVKSDLGAQKMCIEASNESRLCVQGSFLMRVCHTVLTSDPSDMFIPVWLMMTLISWEK